MPLRPAPQLIATSLQNLAVNRLSQPILRFFGTLLELHTRATDRASPRLIVCARARDFQGLLHSSDSPFLATPCFLFFYSYVDDIYTSQLSRSRPAPMHNRFIPACHAVSRS